MTSEPNEDELNLCSQDPDLVRRLAETGATLIILDFPPGSEFGIDMKQWHTGSDFRGVKMIPPGVHFVYYSNVCMNSVAPRTGLFHCFREKEVLAFRWDLKDEIIVKVSDEDHERLTANRRDLDRFLGCYPFETLRKWTALSDKLTDALVRNIRPDGELIFSAQQFVPAEFKHGQYRSQSNELPDLEEVESTRIHFTSLPSRRHPFGASAAEVTRCGIDSSYVLDQLLDRIGCANLLGELQMAFLVFLCGQNLEGFEHWKRLLKVICNAESCIERSELQNLFNCFISLLHFQLKEIPSDFFLDIVSRENFLTDCLSRFFRNVADSAPSNGSLRSRSSRFQAHLTKVFKWDFDQDPDEEQPQIVQLDEV